MAPQCFLQEFSSILAAPIRLPGDSISADVSCLSVFGFKLSLKVFMHLVRVEMRLEFSPLSQMIELLILLLILCRILLRL